MRFTYSKEVDALAVELVLGGRSATMKKLGPGINADFDAKGRLITIEVLDASTHYAQADLDQIAAPVHWLTLAEAAKESGLSPSTLRVQINNGRIPGVKKGRDWMIAQHELWNYLEKRAASGRPATRKRARQSKTRVIR